MPGARSNPVFRSTLVLTGRDGQVRNFASLEELPPELRREMDAALRGETASAFGSGALSVECSAISLNGIPMPREETT